MRSFVAVELPAAVRGELARRVEELRHELPPARWVPAESCHLTLLFLGEISPSQEAALTARLGGVFRRAAAFDLRLEGAGCFPPRRPARVAWVGLRPAEALLELQTEVSRVCLEEVPLEREKRTYRPHLTLARCRRPWPREAARRWRAGWSDHLGQTFTVREGVLMESRLDPGGATYHPRARLALGEAR